MNTPLNLEQMLAVQACRDLVLSAAASADAQDHEGLAALFSDDGELVRPGSGPLRGREAIVAAYRARPSDRMTRHLVTSTRVDLVSADRAKGTSLVLLWSGSTQDVAGPFGRRAHGRQVVGEFDDEFALCEGKWCIARREARFVLFYETAS